MGRLLAEAGGAELRLEARAPVNLLVGQFTERTGQVVQDDPDRIAGLRNRLGDSNRCRRKQGGGNQSCPERCEHVFLPEVDVALSGLSVGPAFFASLLSNLTFGQYFM